MRWLDLFSGIGAYALGLEQAGHEVIGFCENEPWARKILKKHWPTKPISWCVKSLRAAMESSEAGLAKISVLPANKKGYKGIPPEKPQPVQDSSGKWLESFAWYDLASGSWRTWQQSFTESWEQFLGPWPAAGMMRNGIAWEREPLVPPTIAPGHTFLLTPTATDGKGSSQARYFGSQSLRLGRTSAQLRTSKECPIYLNPSFAEILMGLPKDYTALETQIRPASSEN